MNELSDADVIEALHAEFDRVPLPESLTARIGRRYPVTGRGEPKTLTAATDRPPRARRRRRVVSIGLIAAAVAAILVGAVIVRSASNEPSAGPAGLDSATELPSVRRQMEVATLPSRSLPSRTAPSSTSTALTYLSTDIKTWLHQLCDKTWPSPAGSAPLKIEPDWPPTVLDGLLPEGVIRVTNLTDRAVETYESDAVVVVRNGVVVGVWTDADAALVGVAQAEIPAGATVERRLLPIRLTNCSGKALPPGPYELILGHLMNPGRIAYSAPFEISLAKG